MNTDIQLTERSPLPVSPSLATASFWFALGTTGLFSLTWFFQAPTSFSISLLVCAFLATNVGLSVKIWLKMNNANYDVDHHRKQLAFKIYEKAERMAKVGGWELDLDTFDVSWTDEVFRIHELPVGQYPHLEEAFSYYDGASRPIIQKRVEEAVRYGTPFDEELALRTAKGRRIWVRAIGELEYKNGKPFRLNGTFQDITERAEAVNWLERYFSLSMDMMCIARDDGYFQRVSPSFMKILGYTEEEFLNRPFISFVHPDDVELTFREMKALNEGQPSVLFENRYLTADGSIKWLAWMATPVMEEKLIYATARDITERKRNEQIQYQQNRLLDSIRLAQTEFITASRARDVFESLLSLLLEVTDSTKGFIGEAFVNDEGQPYLKTHAITNIAWNKETQDFFDSNAPQGLQFTNLETLFGQVLVTQAPVVSNNPKADPRSGGLPEGHPPLESFLGLPFFNGDTLVGMVGMANRPDGYDDNIIKFLQPFLSTCAHLVEAHRNERKRLATEEELQDSEARNRALLSAIPDLMLQVHRDGSILRIQGSEDDSLFASQLSLQDNISDVLPVHWAEPLMHHIGTAVEHDVPQLFESSFSKDGIFQEYEARIVKAEANSALLLFRDITERNKLFRMKDEFISVVSHELRTPLTSIAGSLGLLTGGALGELPDSIQSMVDIAHRNSERLIRLINDILDVQKIEAGHLEVKDGNHELQPMLRLSLEAIQGLAEKHEVVCSLECQDEPLWVNVDQDKFHQVMANLLSNAVKFSSSGGNVEVHLGQEENMATISVRDQGVGISPDLQTQIFQKFAQGDSSNTRQLGGTGLGLYITKAIVEQYGGSIFVDSEPGKGSTFTVQLPLFSGKNSTEQSHARELSSE